jgi:hydrogenase nickel incorporation protein HypA/HybF
MHELSVVASLFEILEEKVKEQKGKRIILVQLQIGALSGIVPELLATAFEMYKKDTIAADAELTIKTVPLKVKCQDCQNIMIMDDFVFICASCSSTNLQTIEGTEMILEKMDIEI